MSSTNAYVSVVGALNSHWICSLWIGSLYHLGVWKKAVPEVVRDDTRVAELRKQVGSGICKACEVRKQ